MRSQQQRYPTSPDLSGLNTRYTMLAVSESIDQLAQQIRLLSIEITDLKKQQQEMLLQRLEQCQKEFLTIEDVEKLFDISRRTQQEERTNLRLGYRKKRDGAKVVYEHHHLANYIHDFYDEFIAKKK